MKHARFDVSFLAESGAERRRRRFLAYQNRIKRAVDVLGVLLIAPLAVPLIAAIWALVRLDGGPGFFGHIRIGRDGAEFRCWKIRTMCVDAEARLAAHLADDPQAAREWAETYKLADDPRITRIGDILRKTSLDELPQLWNVLLGQMSLVGPRPVTAAELAEYAGYEWAYLSCRPGITGLWQVSGRNAVAYSTRVGMDVTYVMTAGLAADFGILWKTIGVVLRRTGQ